LKFQNFHIGVAGLYEARKHTANKIDLGCASSDGGGMMGGKKKKGIERRREVENAKG
jgi:hypothetical protein